MKIHPVGKYILVGTSAPERIGGLLVPDKAKKKLETLVVQAIGPEVTRFQVGQSIVPARHANPVAPEAFPKNVAMLHEDEIMAVIELEPEDAPSGLVTDVGSPRPAA